MPRGYTVRPLHERTVSVQDKEQFITLVNMHKGSVFRLAYGYLRNRADAEDVVQEVFLKLHRFGGSFDSDEHA